MNQVKDTINKTPVTSGVSITKFFGMNQVKTLISAGIVVGVGVGAFIVMNLPKGGSGLGITPGDSISKNTAVSVDSQTQSSVPPANQNQQQSQENSSNHSQDKKPVEVVRIIIDERAFYLWDGKNQSRGEIISLEKIFELVKQAAGNTDGIKLSISRTVNSRASAEEALQSGLKNAQIPEDAIHWQTEAIQP